MKGSVSLAGASLGVLCTPTTKPQTSRTSLVKSAWLTKLTTGEEYRLPAGGADDARGVGSAFGCAVYVDFCL